MSYRAYGGTLAPLERERGRELTLAEMEMEVQDGTIENGCSQFSHRELCSEDLKLTALCAVASKFQTVTV